MPSLRYNIPLTRIKEYSTRELMQFLNAHYHGDIVPGLRGLSVRPGNSLINRAGREMIITAEAGEDLDIRQIGFIPATALTLYIQSNTTSNTDFSTSSGGSGIATSFQLSAGQVIDGLTIRAKAASGGSGPYTVQIEGDSSGPDGSALATVTGVNTNDFSGSHTNKDFDLDSPFEATESTTYWITISTVNGGSYSGTLDFEYQNSDVYASGNKATTANYGASWTQQSGEDNYFRVYHKMDTGKVYLSDGGVTGADRSNGFLKKKVLRGEQAILVYAPFMGGFAGLTKGQDYYTDQATRGAITTNTGSGVRVARAISDTKVQIALID